MITSVAGLAASVAAGCGLLPTADPGCSLPGWTLTRVLVVDSLAQAASTGLPARRRGRRVARLATAAGGRVSGLGIRFPHRRSARCRRGGRIRGGDRARRPEHRTDGGVRARFHGRSAGGLDVGPPSDHRIAAVRDDRAGPSGRDRPSRVRRADHGRGTAGGRTARALWSEPSRRVRSGSSSTRSRRRPGFTWSSSGGRRKVWSKAMTSWTTCSRR